MFRRDEGSEPLRCKPSLKPCLVVSKKIANIHRKESSSLDQALGKKTLGQKGMTSMQGMAGF